VNRCCELPHAGSNGSTDMSYLNATLMDLIQHHMCDPIQVRVHNEPPDEHPSRHVVQPAAVAGDALTTGEVVVAGAEQACQQQSYCPRAVLCAQYWSAS
jgi:hypothetical protein